MRWHCGWRVRRRRRLRTVWRLRGSPSLPGEGPWEANDGIRQSAAPHGTDFPPPALSCVAPMRQCPSVNPYDAVLSRP
jgi:hypothetical protein